MARENTVRAYAYDENDQANVSPGPVTRDFESNKSLSSKATRFGQDAANDAHIRNREAANDSKFGRVKNKVSHHLYEGYREERNALMKRIAESGYADELEFVLNQLQAFEQLGAKNAAKQLIGNVLQRLILRAITPELLTIAGGVCFFQFVFGGVSLLFIGSWATIRDFVENNLLGKAVDMAARLFGSGLDTLLPLDTVAFAFWGIAVIVGFIAFLGFMLFFTYALRINLLKSAFSSSVLFLCLALTIAMPVIPSLLIWVLFIIRSESSFLGMALEHHKTSSAQNDL